MPTIKDALDIIGKLTVAEQESLKTMLLSPAFVKSLNIEDFVAKERFANGRVCPLCGCIHVVRNGHRKDGTQRYVCKDCGKSFVIATNSIVSGTRKDLSVWEQYIDCMMNGLSIRKTAVACGIHRNTAFLWRHKILDALQNMADDVTLDGIIEADETFFAISYKGNHSKSKTFAMPRKAHKRGHSTHIRGLSQEKVCVPCAVRACLETSAFIVTRRHVDKKRLCAAAKTREDCQTVPQRSDGQRMGACTSSPAPCFWRRSEAQNRPA